MNWEKTFFLVVEELFPFNPGEFNPAKVHYIAASYKARE